MNTRNPWVVARVGECCYNTPPTESMSGLQPNTPQPLTPGFPHRRWVVASGNRTPNLTFNTLPTGEMSPVALQHNWWHLSSWEGVKGQVWASIPTGNNPPAMRESQGEGLRCIGLQTWHALNWRDVIKKERDVTNCAAVQLVTSLSWRGVIVAGVSVLVVASTDGWWVIIFFYSTSLCAPIRQLISA